MKPASNASRPALRLVQGVGAQPIEWSWFCGRCAAPSPGAQAPPPTARVCRSCGLGLLLETRRDLIPSTDDAFLVIDSGLSVQAVSRQAEALLAVTEEAVVNRPVSELLVAADSEAPAPGGFAAAIASAAAAADEPVTAIVRPWNTFGVRIRARVAPCGPPRAALVVLENPQARRRLRVVD